MRIVSLLPSSTEVVCRLGYEKNLVGRSHECDYPLTVHKLPICSEPKFDPSQGSSRDIDQQVKTIVAESLSVYRIHTDKLKELAPDIIITQDHCEVCAVSVSDVKAAVCTWLKSQPKIVTLSSNNLDDIWKSFVLVAEAFGEPQKGQELIRQCQNQMLAISKKAKAIGECPSILCIEWFDPLMAAGNWIPEFIDMLGAKNAFGHAGEHSPIITWDDVMKKDPDIIVNMPCGWDIKRSLNEIKVLTDQSGWKNLKAVKNGQVYITDGHQYFNRPGPRLVDSLEILAEIMYPKHFHFGHHGPGWQKLD